MFTSGLYIHEEFANSVKFSALAQSSDGAVECFVFPDCGLNAYTVGDVGVVCDPSSKPVIRGPDPEHPIHPPPYLDSPDLEPRDDPEHEFHAYQMFCSRATLCGVASIQVCRDIDGDTTPCLGMMLHYRDGTRETVGQWRWDRPIRSYQVDKGSATTLNFIEVQRGNLIALRLGLPSDKEDVTSQFSWFGVPLDGEIVWWFDYGRNILDFVDAEG